MVEIICTMEERFPAPVETVWNLVTDLDHWQWRSDLKGLTVTGPDTFTEHGRDGFSTRFTITCRKANALWEFTLENENLTGTWRGEFRAVEDGTRVTFTETDSAKEVVDAAVCRPGICKVSSAAILRICSGHW